MQHADTIRDDGAGDAATMGLLEIAALFGGAGILIQGFGVVIERLTGTNLAALACLTPFLYTGAGFVAGRYGTLANGVWAGIMVAAVNALAGFLLSLLNLPGDYRGLTGQLAAQVPAGVIGVIIVAAVFSILLNVLLGGSLCGALGGAIAQARPFRPR